MEARYWAFVISQACKISQIKALKHNAISVNGAYEKSKANQTVYGILPVL